MTFERVFAFLASFAVAALITPLVRMCASRRGVWDMPDGTRRHHSAPVALWGGVALWIAMAAVGLPAWKLGLLTDAKIDDTQLAGIFIGSLLLVAGGMWDDVKGLKPWRQFLFPLMAVGVSVACGIGVSYITNPFVSGTGPYGRALYYIAPGVGTVVALLWLLGTIYTTKLLDGLDGLVSGVGVIGSMILFVVSLYWDAPLSGTSYLALITAGACLGFLIYNIYPASIFLGEGGATLVGYFLGVLAIISGAKIATALLIMGIPILDVAWIIVRRIVVEKKSFARGDRKHLHYRLLDAGFTHRQAVAFLWCLTAFFGTISIFLQSTQKLVALGGLTFVMLCLGIFVVKKSKVNSYPAAKL